jgi:DNA (cytosine-5)-methyltransferase 1
LSDHNDSDGRIRLTALDLFAGAGGLGLGLQDAGFAVVGANEFDPVFASSYALNHPKTKVIVGDILSAEVMNQILAIGEGVDLIAGGPPCQGFSTVGSKREADPRNRLFYAFLEVVAALRPRAVLFENVSGFKRMYGSRAYHALIQGLTSHGYQTHHSILNAANFGVPQLRDRTFVIGFRDHGVRFSFPRATHAASGGLLGERPFLTLRDALSDLPIVKSGEAADAYLSEPRNEYQETMRADAPRLEEQVGPTHGPRLLRAISLVPDGGSVLDLPENLRPRSYFANTYARLWWDRPSTTITRNLGTPSSSRCIHPLANRGLTTREGARLQSFPDRYVFTGSRGQKNLQIGNAVPPLLARALGEEIAISLSRSGCLEAVEENARAQSV